MAPFLRELKIIEKSHRTKSNFTKSIVSNEQQERGSRAPGVCHELSTTLLCTPSHSTGKIFK